MKMEIMLCRRPGIMIDSTWKVPQVKQLFSAMQVDYVSIVDGGQNVGIVVNSELESLIKNVSDHKEVSIGELVRHPGQFWSIESSVADAYDYMRRYKLKHLGVVDKHTVVGYVEFDTLDRLMQGVTPG